MSDPEFSFYKLKIKGATAFNAAGWTLKLLVIAIAVSIMAVPLAWAIRLLR